jgi:hypothetical protein
MEAKVMQQICRCSICGVSIFNYEQWNDHIKSKNHKSKLQSLISDIDQSISVEALQLIEKRLHRNVKDDFFESRKCDRCGSEEAKRICVMSWFTEQKICMECSEDERQIRVRIREYYKDPQADLKFEGCGFIPSL